MVKSLKMKVRAGDGGSHQPARSHTAMRQLQSSLREVRFPDVEPSSHSAAPDSYPNMGSWPRVIADSAFLPLHLTVTHASPSGHFHVEHLA